MNCATETQREPSSIRIACARRGIRLPGDDLSPSEAIPFVEKRIAEHKQNPAATCTEMSGDFIEWKQTQEDLHEFLAHLHTQKCSNGRAATVELLVCETTLPNQPLTCETDVSQVEPAMSQSKPNTSRLKPNVRHREPVVSTKSPVPSRPIRHIRPTNPIFEHFCNFLSPGGFFCYKSPCRTRGNTMTDTEQFEVFMRNYQNMVFSTALRLLANESEAQDVSQEVFLKAYERFADLRHSPTVGGWLKTVTTNLCLNHLSRYRGRWRFFSELFQREGEDDFTVEIPAPESTSDHMNEMDQRQIVEKALHRLPAGQRVPLALYHYEGKSYEEIAEITGSSLSKVKTDIFRAREALRKKLKIDLAGEEGWEEYGGKTAPNPREKTPPRRPERFSMTRVLAPRAI